MLSALRFATALALGLSAMPLPASAQELSAPEQYVRALAAMQALPQPPYVTFESNFSAPDMRINLAPYDGYGTLYLSIGAGASSAMWRTDYRPAERRIVLETGNGTKLLALSPIFNPTWQGAYDWVRYGLQGAPARRPTEAVPQPPGTAQLKTIAIVSALSPGAYYVEDAGAQACPGGEPGRHLHLKPRFDPANHPLSDVVVDSKSERFCSMRFTLQSSGLVYAMNGWMELHFGQVGAYWLVTGGNGNIGMQFFGQQYKSSPIAFSYSNLAFEPVHVQIARKPVFTAALFRRPAPQPSSAPVVREVAAAQPLKTISHVRAIPLCTTLRENVARAIEGLRTNDAVVSQVSSAMDRLGRAYANQSSFARSSDARSSVAVFAGQHDTDPAVTMAQVDLSRLVAQLRHNLEIIYAVLNDKKRFPDPAVTEDDRAAARLKQQLLALAKAQEDLLNTASGMTDTLAMQQMIAQGDGLNGAVNEPAGQPGRGQAKMVGVNDKNVAFDDPLDEMNPSARRSDPAMSAGRVGGPSAAQSPVPASAQAPGTATNNPFERFYGATLQREIEAQKAEKTFASAIEGAAAKCP